MKSFLKYIYEVLLRALLIFARSKDENRAILIFSYPRSGSTWFMNILASTKGAVAIFEPLNPFENQSLKPFSSQHKLINSNQDLLKIVLNILKLKYINRWSSAHTSMGKLFLADHAIVKILRGNFILPWFIQNLPGNKKLFLVRHPGAVVSSTLRSRKNKNIITKELLKNRADLLPDNRYVELIDNANTDYEKLFISWCIENRIILDNQNEKNTLLVFYEDLFLDPQLALGTIFDFIEQPLLQQHQKQLSLHSNTTNKDSSLSHSNPLSRWKDDFDDKETSRMQEILDIFEIEIYNMQEVIAVSS